jgi:ATP-dependent helicase/nuclease subunit B
VYCLAVAKAKSETPHSQSRRSGARLVLAADAAARLRVATEWARGQPADSEVLVVAPTWEAADELARATADPPGARFGVTRLTVERLAARLATPALARARRVPGSGLVLAALAARAIHRLDAEGALPHFRPVAKRPGFAPAVARTLEELRMNGVEAAALEALGPAGVELARLLRALEDELAAARLADRALVFAAARDAVAGATPPLGGAPLLLLDVAPGSAAEEALVAALARRAPSVLATVPAGDERSRGALERALGVGAEDLPPPDASRALGALQAHLFVEPPPAAAVRDDTVSLRSWPGEARECVEIARGLQQAAARGVPFDRMAVLLHAPAGYAAHLEEALGRAAIPAFFARGTRRPHPAGRALLALLACAAEGLSARRFAEYLSLAQVPDPTAPADAWVPPADDLLAPTPPPLAAADEPGDDPRQGDPDAAAAPDGTLRTPWRWEQLLVDAAVIGGVERWATRLDGLAHELALRRRAVAEGEEGRARYLDRQLADLGHLRDFALPLVACLAGLPKRASWGEWLASLDALVHAALRHPEPVLGVLAELKPMAPVGPVELDEVALVLGPRLRDLVVPPPRRRYGAVLVTTPHAARGLAFDVVFVPGLAEKVFPGKIVEDPILRDAERDTLRAPLLATQPARVAAERLALRLAVGAASERVVLSYPRLDVEQARPRVPSFYALEVFRPIEGRLLGFDELRRRAEGERTGRLGWPAPDAPADAIDEAEYDLALLAPFVDAAPDDATGTAHYLLGTNPHLARALRARGRRWLRRWTPADGLVDPDESARAALAAHQLDARAFSPTALQHFAACPYRFLLQAIHRLEPREEPVAIERLDPLTRGEIFHDIQFEALTRLREAGLLPVTEAGLDAARAILDAAVETVAKRHHDELAPAIERVWDDAITALRADLREWLRRAAADADGWTPLRFELAFGLADRARTYADPASVPEPVTVLDGLRLRGSIDLVERHARGTVRATDHKTGKVYAKEDVVVGGGLVLQPVLYALACEQLLPEPVESGRLYYCTTDGGYTERLVPLDPDSRAAARAVVDVVGRALSAGFLPAAPAKGACRWCDYRPVCGPYEELRTSRKPADRLADLTRLRSMP